MTRQRALQRVSPGAQFVERGSGGVQAEHGDRIRDGRDQLGQPGSPYLTSAEAAVYLRFPSLRAFYRFLETHPVARKRRGRVLLFDKRALDLTLRNETA